MKSKRCLQYNCSIQTLFCVLNFIFHMIFWKRKINKRPWHYRVDLVSVYNYPNIIGQTNQLKYFALFFFFLTKNLFKVDYRWCFFDSSANCPSVLIYYVLLVFCFLIVGLSKFEALIFYLLNQDPDNWMDMNIYVWSSDVWSH